MQGLRIPGKYIDGELKYKRLYGVRCCETSTCELRNLWNRDVNAAINILHRLRRDLAGEEHPGVFCRRGRVPWGMLNVNEQAEEEERETIQGL
jgi:transposase